jgi:hypothetical protein
VRQDGFLVADKKALIVDKGFMLSKESWIRSADNIFKVVIFHPPSSFLLE